MTLGRLAAAVIPCSASAAFAGSKYIDAASAQRPVGTSQTPCSDILPLDTRPQDLTVGVLLHGGGPTVSPLPTALALASGFYLPGTCLSRACCRFTANANTTSVRAVAVHDAGPYGGPVTRS